MRKLKYYVAAFLLAVAGVLTYRFNDNKASATVPYTNTLVSVDNSGNLANGSSNQDFTTVSGDGRYVTFSNTASNLVSGDTNGTVDIFVRDTISGTTQRVNVSSSGVQSTVGAQQAKISNDGRFVAFMSGDSSLVAGDTNNVQDIFVRDLQAGTTEMVSINSSGAIENQIAPTFDISGDGRYVVFSSYATNLVAGDTNGNADVFVRDRKLGTTRLLSKSDAGTLADSTSYKPSISCDGSKVSFYSAASNLVPSDTNGQIDTFVVDRVGGDAIENITINGNGLSGTGDDPWISCDGSTVLFSSDASNLVSSDTNGMTDLFTYNISSGVTQLVTATSSGTQSNYYTNNGAAISGDGRYIVFTTYANNLVNGDTNAATDVFLKDMKTGSLDRVSMRPGGIQTTTTYGFSNNADISADGKTIVFQSYDDGLATGDTNGQMDVFKASSGTSICE